MNALECWLNVEWTRLFDELGETVESLELRGHCVQERRGKYVHALYVREPKLIALLSV